MNRKTGLVIDADGNYHIVVTDPEGVDIHNVEEIVELFLQENKIYEECEVYSED